MNFEMIRRKLFLILNNFDGAINHAHPTGKAVSPLFLRSKFENGGVIRRKSDGIGKKLTRNNGVGTAGGTGAVNFPDHRNTLFNFDN